MLPLLRLSGSFYRPSDRIHYKEPWNHYFADDIRPLAKAEFFYAKLILSGVILAFMQEVYCF
jgi:hypothetical protein